MNKFKHVFKTVVFSGLVFLIIPTLPAACQYASKEEYIREIKQKYSIEELNYFYEIAFYNEVERKTRPIRKWNKDVYMYLEGAERTDSVVIIHLVNELRQMQLPIDFHFVGDSLQANMKIYFGERDFLIEKLPDHFFSVNNRGHAVFGSNEISIGILSSMDTVMRGTVLQEEFIQSLGLISDSWTNPGSLFFQGVENVRSFTEKDKKLLSLLYEDFFAKKSRYTVQDYERDFGPLLYKVQSAEKIAQHLQENNTPPGYLDSLTKYIARTVCFKYPSKVWVRQKGASTKQDSAFCQKIISRFNEALEGKLALLPSSDSTYFPHINLLYSDNRDLSETPTTMTFFRDSAFVYTYTIASEARMDLPSSFGQYARNEYVLLVMSMALGLNFSYEMFEPDEDGDPTLKPEYWEILSLYYEPIFYGGIKVSEIERARRLLAE